MPGKRQQRIEAAMKYIVIKEDWSTENHCLMSDEDIRAVLEAKPSDPDFYVVWWKLEEHGFRRYKMLISPEYLRYAEVRDFPA
jgi:hypothetical protein